MGTYEDKDGFEKPKREDLPTPTSPKRSKKYRPSMWVIANLKPQLSRLWVQGEAGKEVGPRGLLPQLRQTFFQGEKFKYFLTMQSIIEKWYFFWDSNIFTL